MALRDGTRDPGKLVIIFLWGVAVAATFEVAKQWTLPRISLWASHGITVGMCGAVASAVAYALGRQLGKARRTAAAYQQAEADRIGLTDAIGQASEAVVIADDQGRIQYVNPAFTRMTGYTREEVLGRNPRFLKSGRQDQAFYGELWNTITAGRIWNGELVNRRKDGSFYTEAMSITPVRDSGGKICKYIAIKQDVTARRAALEAQALLASIVEASQDAIFTSTPEGTIQSWNRGAEQLYGYTAAEIIGQPLDKLISAEFLADRETVAARLQRGEQVPPFVGGGVRKDGSRFDVFVSVSPIRNAAGETTAVAAINRDITLLKKAEQAIASLASIVESADDAIFTLTPEGIFRTWNQGAEVLWGYTAEEILGKHISLLVKPDRYPEQREVLESIRRGELVSSLETTTWTKDGQPLDVSITVSPIRNAAGKVVGSSTIARNISRRKRAEEALRRSEEKYRSLIANIPDLVWTADQDGRLIFAGGGWDLAQRFVADQLGHGGAFLKSIHPEDLEMVRRAYEALFANQQAMDVEFRFQRQDGSWAWLRNRSAATYEKDGKRYADGILSDLSERKRMEERLAYQASHDALTDLPSRSICEDLLQRALARARRSAKLVALLQVDLDRFRIVNETLGHPVGDVLLQQAARRLAGCLRESEVPSRIGGDKFAVILTEIDDPQMAGSVAQRIIDTLNKPFEVRGTEVFLGVSVGIALFPQDAQDAATLQNNADSAMQIAKKLGKNRCQTFTVDMQAAATERLALESELHRALQRGELSVEYQPLFNLKTGHISGAEALLRWQNSRFGRVSPSVFIPLAEETGLIVPMGAWVLRQACNQVRIWREAGYGSFKVGVNFSAVQFTYGNLVSLIAQALAEAGVSGSSLVVEVTESAIMRDAKDSARQLAALRKLGAKVSLDDFGTGYSSLSYLEALPIDSLKIDRSFVQRLDEGGTSGMLVQAIGALAQSLGLRTVAEGVETQRQLDLLKAMHCDLAQGFLLAKPAPPECLKELLSARALIAPSLPLTQSSLPVIPLIQ